MSKDFPEQPAFPAFWFEANEPWGTIVSAVEWHTYIAKHYRVGNWRPSDGKTVAAQLMEWAHATTETERVENGIGKPKWSVGYLPDFSLYEYGGHTAKLTLAEWAKQKGIYDVLAGK